MHNIGLLLKNYLICSIGNLRRKNTRTKAVVGISIITTICALWFAFFTWCMFMMASAGAEQNMQASVLIYGLVISLFMSTILALQKVTGGQKANDTEMLLSMPFRKTEIMIAKGLSRIAVNLLVVAMFFLPCTIAYLGTAPFSLPATFGCIVTMLSIPLFGVGLSYIVDYLVTVCFSNSKFGNIAKAVLTLIILIVAIVIYEFFMLNMNSPFVVDMILWMVQFNPLVMIPLIAAVLGIFILGNWLNALLLNRETHSGHVKAIAIGTKATTPFRAILKNENNRYFNSPTMMLNTLIGPLGMIAITIWIMVDNGNTLFSFIQAQMGVSIEIIYLLVALLFATLQVLTYPAASSISLEGKQLWILRSMPIPAYKILSAKVLFNILLLAPVSTVCAVLMQIILQMSVLSFIALLIIPILASVMVSYAGVFINLCFPKLEFESEAAVIKQSMSSFIMMLGGGLLLMGLLGLTIYLSGLLAFAAVLAIIMSIFVLLDTVLIVLTYTVGQRMFNHL